MDQIALTAWPRDRKHRRMADKIADNWVKDGTIREIEPHQAAKPSAAEMIADWLTGKRAAKDAQILRNHWAFIDATTPKR